MLLLSRAEASAGSAAQGLQSAANASRRTRPSMLTPPQLRQPSGSRSNSGSDSTSSSLHAQQGRRSEQQSPSVGARAGARGSGSGCAASTCKGGITRQRPHLCRKASATQLSQPLIISSLSSSTPSMRPESKVPTAACTRLATSSAVCLWHTSCRSPGQPCSASGSSLRRHRPGACDRAGNLLEADHAVIARSVRV